MDYVLKFVSLINGQPLAGVGMAGNIMIIVNELLLLTDDDNVWVEMGTDSVCGDGSWYSYFTRLDDNLPTSDKVLIELKPPRPPIVKYNGNYKHSDGLMVKSREVFFKRFKLIDELNDEIDAFYESKIKGVETLGCQIRLGDMKNTGLESPIEDYINKIKEIIEINPTIKQIFIATDDNSTIEHINNTNPFNIPVIYQNDIYRTSSMDPYERIKNDRNNHNINLCNEVVKDVFLLTKCDYFLRAKTSAVSIVTTMFSERIKETYTI